MKFRDKLDPFGHDVLLVIAMHSQQSVAPITLGFETIRNAWKELKPARDCRQMLLVLRPYHSTTP